jgi:DNA invertase Pin-like site-specific DNA recombinase
MMRTAIYARTSRDCLLSSDEQIDELKRIAAERVWTVEHVFTDRARSAKKGQDRRSGELVLLHTIRSGAIDRVLIHGIDRIGKSLTELVGFLETCRSAGVAVYLHQEKIDSAETNGLSLFDLSMLLAQHIRQGRRDRILRGQAAARALSVKFGRPSLRKSKVEKAKRELTAGKGVRQVARLAGISPASVSRIKNSINVDASAAPSERSASSVRSYPAERPSLLRD